MAIAQGDIASRPRFTGRLAGPKGLLRQILARPAGVIGLAVVLLTLVMAAAAPLIAPHDPSAIAMGHRSAAIGDQSAGDRRLGPRQSSRG